MPFAATHKVVTTTLAAAVANAGTTTVSYPTGTNQAFFTAPNAGTGHVVVIDRNNVYSGAQIAVSFGASNVTITNNSGETWAAGARLDAQLDYATSGFISDAGTAIPVLTDSSGGTAADTIAAIGGTYSQTEVRNAIASLTAKVNAILESRLR